jgi:hypothetical protein
MIITNLLANMVVIGKLYTIETNTPAFQEYAFHAMVTNAQAVAAKWHLDESLMTTNKITFFKAFPTPYGIKASIVFGGRYDFDAYLGGFQRFVDIPYDCTVTLTDNVEANDAILEQWMRATNLLTMEKAQQLVKDRVQSLGISMHDYGFKKAKEKKQNKYEWRDGKIYPLPYYQFYWHDEKTTLEVHVSGLSSNVVEFFFIGPTIIFPRPTNYFEMLGLPHKPIFVRRLSKLPGQPQAYEPDELVNRK